MNKIFIICIICLIPVIGQNKTKKNPFQMVDVPDSIRYELGLFSEKEEKLDKVYLNIYIYNLMNVKDYKFHDGIYYFRLMGSHIHGRIFIYNNNKISIFKNYTIEDLLNEYQQFLKENKLSEHIKIKYLEVICEFLNNTYESYKYEFEEGMILK